MNLATADDFVNPRVHVGADFDEFNHLSPDWYDRDCGVFLPYPNNHMKHIRYRIHVHIAFHTLCNMYMYMYIDIMYICLGVTLGMYN